MVHRLTERLRPYPGCSARVMDALNLNYGDDDFDAAFSVFGVMYFGAEATKAFAEMARVVRPAGIVGVVHWAVPEGVPFFTILGRLSIVSMTLRWAVRRAIEREFQAPGVRVRPQPGRMPRRPLGKRPGGLSYTLARGFDGGNSIRSSEWSPSTDPPCEVGAGHPPRARLAADAETRLTVPEPTRRPMSSLPT